jgi:hypothetical protein
MKSTFGKRREFVRFIEDALATTGTATEVSNLRDGTYETDGRAYLRLKRDARDIKAGWRSTGTGSAERLGELKTMHERGLVTDEEYEVTRRQILDRM